MRKQNDWVRWATELTGPRFAEFQVGLTRYNAVRFQNRRTQTPQKNSGPPTDAGANWSQQIRRPSLTLQLQPLASRRRARKRPQDRQRPEPNNNAFPELTNPAPAGIFFGNAYRPDIWVFNSCQAWKTCRRSTTGPRRIAGRSEFRVAGRRTRLRDCLPGLMSGTADSRITRPSSWNQRDPGSV